MSVEGGARWNASVRAVSHRLALVSITITALAFIGQVLSIPTLSSIVVDWDSMSILSAVTEACLGLILATGIARQPASLPLLVTVAVLALLALGSTLMVGEDRISATVLHLFARGSATSARTSTASAIATLLIAAALLPAPNQLSARQRNAVAGIAFLIGLTALLGYVYFQTDVRTSIPFRSLSLNSALSLVALALATILSEPEHGWARVIASPERSGRVTRRRLVYALIPVGVGLVLVRASQSGMLAVGAVMSLQVICTVVPLLWVVLRDGSALAALDAERADRLRIVQELGDELQLRLDAQAEALSQSNAKLLAVAEAASESSEIRYRQLFDSIEAGFCVIDVVFAEDSTAIDYRFVEVNAAFARQTGLAHAAGQSMRDLDPRQDPKWVELYGMVARSGAPISVETPATDSGGRWFDLYVFQIDASANRVGILSNDITARRASELELKAMNETLEHRVDAAVAEREAAQEALRQSQKMEAIGQLTGGVAHDFNNLLTPILGSLDLLNRRGGMGEREQRLISGALQSAERAKILVQRLLAFARRQPLQPGPVDVGALISNMAELVASTTGPQIRVDVDIEPDLPPAIGDANQLEMAILNLCVNARDAMPDGGRLSLSVTASKRPDQHPDLHPGQLRELADDTYIRLSVVDDGSGMDAATAARAVEPFFSTKGIGKGTGLGLSMVHGLALQLGGAMTITSHAGLGTRIDLYLRAGVEAAGTVAGPGADPVAEPANDDVPAACAKPGRALVVDDEAFVRMTTAHLLQELGFTTEECESGIAAESRLRAGEAFDLIVTDHLMPGLTGAELASRLAEARPEIAVLIVSGFSNAEAIAPELNFLLKPFRKDDLAAAVERVMLSQSVPTAAVGSAHGTM